jgi:hypothetical protein
MKLQQGDVIIKDVEYEVNGEKLDHLVLAEGESTGHAHRLTEGLGALIVLDNILHLQVFSENAKLRHEEHNEIVIPKRNYKISIVREFDPFENEIRAVRD